MVPRSPLDELSASATQARAGMVHKVSEGLRDEAFKLARDIGVDGLSQAGGLRNFVNRLRSIVSPRSRAPQNWTKAKDVGSTEHRVCVVVRF